MKVRFTTGVGLVGCTKSEVIDFDDDLSEKEIQKEFELWVWEQVGDSSAWEVVK